MTEKTQIVNPEPSARSRHLIFSNESNLTKLTLSQKLDSTANRSPRNADFSQISPDKTQIIVQPHLNKAVEKVKTSLLSDDFNHLDQKSPQQQKRIKFAEQEEHPNHQENFLPHNDNFYQIDLQPDLNHLQHTQNVGLMMVPRP